MRSETGGLPEKLRPSDKVIGCRAEERSNTDINTGLCSGIKALKLFLALMRMITAGRKHSKEQKITNLDLPGVVKVR